jgi:signal transduction histidine kinase
MPPKVGARSRPEIARGKRLRLPPKGDIRSAAGAIERPRPGATLASVRRTDQLLDAAIAIAVFAITLVLLAAGDDHATYGGEVTLVGIVLSAFASLPLLYRRRAPIAVFTVTGIASTILRAVAAPAGPPLGPTVALYSVGAARSIQPRVIALVAAILALHLTATGIATGRFPGPEILLGIAVWGGAYLTGERTRLRRERMAELEERAERAEREAERERRLAAAEQRMRIARDLHDSAGHAINVILVHAGLGRLHADNDQARDAFTTIEDVARETVGEIDQLVRVLREDDGNGVEPPPGIAALDTLIARHRGLEVTTTFRGEQRPLPSGVDRAAYRIVQEALTNAARHGDGNASVEIAYGAEAVEVTVTNPAGNGARGDGHGIIGMRERAALLGGTLHAGVRAGRFEVQARLPL